MTLHLHTAERTDALADGLADLLVTPLPDPFAREVVVVPARGVERWLTQRLSHRLGVGARGGDGVCAGVDFVTPHSLVSMLLDRDAEDPWSPDRLAWPLLEVIDSCLDEPGFEDLSRHLGHGDPADERSARRYAVARRLAGLFSSYAVQRPQLVGDWRAGDDTDGSGGPLATDLRWQAELWRRLVDRVDEPGPDLRHTSTLERLAAGADGLDLPGRLSLFGHTRLPVTEVELLRALGGHRDVHLWLPQPSPALWAALAPTAGAGPVARADDDSAAMVGHPLLASLGRDSRELRRTLGEVDTDQRTAGHADPATMLGWLQSDLRANRSPDAGLLASRVRAKTDRSVQVHACHGTARQVDVLREVLVGLLQDDPTLEPRDILVMCPDIETYAPLISAGFGLADVTHEDVGHPAHRLRVRLADRSPGATNPLLGVAAELVELAAGRMTATSVLDLAATEPVRARFGFTDDHLERMTRWVDHAAIRWGYDRDHRGAFGLELDANTWLTGLQRVLLGAAMSGQGHRVVRTTLPLDDVGDGDLDLVGGFVEMVDRLHTFVAAAGEASSVADWTTALGRAVHGLTASDADDAWRVAQFDRELARISAGVGDHETRLRHADVRALLRHRLRGRPTRSNFRTGTLTVCTMVPMRSVPHRVVCLVGLDDGVFPRLESVDGDDVLARRPLTGERDIRSEDRQLLLDAIGAATETLVITYAGRGEHTGDAKPPAVPLGELLDTLDRTSSDAVRDDLVLQHPLQPFDEANLTAGALVRAVDRPFSFDRSALAGARAARAPRPVHPALVTDPLVAPDLAEEVSLSDLQDFFAHPVRGFLRHRLRVTTPYDVEETKDAIPITLDGLEKWDVGDRLVRDVLAGGDPQAAMLAEQLRGLLPPEDLGSAMLTDIVTRVRPLVEAALPLRSGPARTLDVDIDLGDRRLTGTVGHVFGNNLVAVSYSTLAAKHRMAAWLDALALAAGHPDENWTAHTIGRWGRSAGRRALISPMPDDDARAHLRELVDVMERGQREPLPLPVKTTLAFAEEFTLAARSGGGGQTDPDAKAAAEWVTPRFNETGFPREDGDQWHVRAWGEQAPYELLAAPLLADEVRDEDGAPHRLGHYALRVWSPLLAHELVRGI
ncbi:exodeoxyribonuclease V subunit gamma [Nocardioides hwasunensis]|uniref:RecBCD enzyme subunit RecC n=1 Tax=Nocardioides hwasunensis TaxID=397258 RepID=A0ABR8MKC3_9ACTN|nr:exodeoxyribonuclease V subunit gamma [Nocardioides hwasunensis]MBD3916482.1 exodeoxyribonuclease V subunit gamma [Nocardioides hwasunensis]